MTVFATDQLCKYYRRGTPDEVRALDGVSLEVLPGRVTLLTGPSGSGKTTLLALLGALERPTGGKVAFQGRELGACSDVELARARRKMGFVFQDFGLIAGLPAWENITYPLIPRGVPRPERYRRAEELLTEFGMPGKMAARPRELSGGEQQRVAIARALAGRPEVLLADEPTSNLDPGAGRLFLAVLERLRAEGKAVVVSSHDPQLLPLADRVYTLAAGKLQATGGNG